MNSAQSSANPRILVAPLDWGLGHATRCIPVIRALITNGAEVWLAGAGNVQALLQPEFPECPFLHLPGYNVRYGKTAGGTLAALVRQLPRLLQAIKEETQWLQAVVETHKISAVLSDNRYGLHHPAVYSVIITHQLLIKTGTRPTDRLLQRLVYRHINRFHACWVPDSASAENLAGVLSHPKHKPQPPVVYLNPLSRFTATEPVLTHYILILLSGPEPQRTLLEELIIRQAQLFQNPIFIVRGLPGATGLPAVPYHITIVNHLPAATLQKAVENAHIVISRCGYSTVMDMMTLQKRCIFVPTPGQTEQQYLARHLMEKNKALAIAQARFNLKTAVALAETFPYKLSAVEKSEALQTAVAQLLQQLPPIL